MSLLRNYVTNQLRWGLEIFSIAKDILYEMIYILKQCNVHLDKNTEAKMGVNLPFPFMNVRVRNAFMNRVKM